MKTNRSIRITAALAALCMAAALFGGCSKNKEDSSSASESSVTESASESEEEVTFASQRPVAEGDIYAINKFKVKDLPENYVMVQKSQEDGNQHFRYIIDEGRAQMVVYAANYLEDYGLLEDFAGRVRFGMNFNNILYKCDTEFGESKETEVAGFKAESCDYTITQNVFEVDENGETYKDENGNDIKTPVAWYSGRLYFFYSDKDAFYFSVESTDDYWETALADFEANILPNIYIDENAENEPEAETSAEETVTAASSEETSAAE